MVVIHVFSKQTPQAQKGQHENQQNDDNDKNSRKFGLDFIMLEKYLDWFEVYANAFEGLSFLVHFAL